MKKHAIPLIIGGKILLFTISAGGIGTACGEEETITKPRPEIPQEITIYDNNIEEIKALFPSLLADPDLPEPPEQYNDDFNALEAIANNTNFFSQVLDNPHNLKFHEHQGYIEQLNITVSDAVSYNSNHRDNPTSYPYAYIGNWAGEGKDLEFLKNLYKDDEVIKNAFYNLFPDVQPKDLDKIMNQLFDNKGNECYVFGASGVVGSDGNLYIPLLFALKTEHGEYKIGIKPIPYSEDIKESIETIYSIF